MREYFGMINGVIPRFVVDELPFKDLCCDFIDYMPRFTDCFCCVYERDELNDYILRTPCPNGGKHDLIIKDTSFAQWYCSRSNINLIHEKIRDIETYVPIKNYVYLDEDHTVQFKDHNIFDSLGYDTNYKIFCWIILTELLVALNHYRLEDKITFMSECV